MSSENLSNQAVQEKLRLKQRIAVLCLTILAISCVVFGSISGNSSEKKVPQPKQESQGTVHTGGVPAYENLKDPSDNPSGLTDVELQQLQDDGYISKE